MDQLLARHHARDTQIASLEMAMDPPANAGACTGNLSCVYTHTLSWRSPTQPLPMEWNPRAVFEKLFGDTGHDRPCGARSAAAATQEPARLGQRKTGEPENRAGAAGSREGRAVYGSGARRRASHRARGAADRPRAAGNGSAAGSAAGLRRSPGADARPATARVSERSHACDFLHDRQGTERAAVSADWRARGASSAVAPSGPA
jgi:hypothetical protein